MLPGTATRVERQTASHLNREIQREAEARIAALQNDDREELITQHLKALDREWDVERTLQTNFAALSLVGLSLSRLVSRRWLGLAVGVPAFMLQHALQGWCPPLAVLRRLHFRTAKEINEERFAMKALRGDFSSSDAKNIDELIAAIRR